MVSPFDYAKLSQIETYPTVAVQNEEKNVIVYSQSFDAGWKAYQVQSAKFKVQSWINNLFPFLFGKEIKEHVLVNNWANGWVIPNSSLILNHSSFIIIFWPQYLEYLGLILLGGTFTWLFWSSVKSDRD